MNNDLPVSLLVAAFTGAVMLLLPHISPRRYFFAITVPQGFPSSPAGRTEAVVLGAAGGLGVVVDAVGVRQQPQPADGTGRAVERAERLLEPAERPGGRSEIGRASCRERVE